MENFSLEYLNKSMGDMLEKKDLFSSPDSTINSPIQQSSYVPLVPSPVLTPVPTPVQVPVQMQLPAPVQAPVQAHVQAHVQAPVQLPTPVQAPVPVPVQMQLQAPVQAPVQMQLQAPVQVPVQAPVPKYSKSPPQSMFQPPSQKEIKRVKFQNASENNFTISKYTIPKNTLYMTIVLIMIGIALWYMTNDKPKNNKKNKVEEDDE